MTPSSFCLYLQADYNIIKRIDSGALRFLYKLRVLILNDNLIPVLPAHLFRLVSDYGILLQCFLIMPEQIRKLRTLFCWINAAVALGLIS